MTIEFQKNSLQKLQTTKTRLPYLKFEFEVNVKFFPYPSNDNADKFLDIGGDAILMCNDEVSVFFADLRAANLKPL